MYFKCSSDLCAEGENCLVKGPFKNYVIPLLKVVFGVFVCAGGAFAAMMIQTA